MVRAQERQRSILLLAFASAGRSVMITHASYRSCNVQASLVEQPPSTRVYYAFLGKIYIFNAR